MIAGSPMQSWAVRASPRRKGSPARCTISARCETDRAGGKMPVPPRMQGWPVACADRSCRCCSTPISSSLAAVAALATKRKPGVVGVVQSPPTVPPMPMCRLGSCGSRTASPIRPTRQCRDGRAPRSECLVKQSSRLGGRLVPALGAPRAGPRTRVVGAAEGSMSPIRGERQGESTSRSLARDRRSLARSGYREAVGFGTIESMFFMIRRGCPQDSSP